MMLWTLLPLLVAAETDDGLAKKMLPIYVKEAQTYSFAVESAPKEAAELKKEAAFEWLNAARGDTQGAVFLWLRNGRPVALACIFSYPHYRLPGRLIVHELHALDAEKLLVKRNAGNEWKPRAGLARNELAEAVPPAASPGARLVQMRRLAQEFSGHSIDRDAKRWELRLLPTPLHRYSPAKSGVVDGALFAIMSSAGTDPEVLLVIEAREVEGKLRWEYACGRFSDWELHVQRKGKEVYESVPSQSNLIDHDLLHLYRIYPEKVMTPEGKLLARVRQMPSGASELIRVEDK